MTRKEWIEKHLPAYVNDRADGGVIQYILLTKADNKKGEWR